MHCWNSWKQQKWLDHQQELATRPTCNCLRQNTGWSCNQVLDDCVAIQRYLQSFKSSWPVSVFHYVGFKIVCQANSCLLSFSSKPVLICTPENSCAAVLPSSLHQSAKCTAALLVRHLPRSGPSLIIFCHMHIASHTKPPWQGN